MTGITLPTDNQQSRLAPRPAAPQEDVLDTLREYERLARIAEPEYTIVSLFSQDGVEWVPFWLEKTPPAVVHSRVVRGTVITEEWRTWDEALPADDASRAEWLANPATRHRAFTERATLRRAFADVIVGREQGQATVTAKPPVTGSTLTHPWDEAPTTVNEGEDVWAPTARPDADWTPVKDAWEPAPGPTGVTYYAANSEAADAEAPSRPAPQDHLPGNRAQRRAKKRGRR